MKHILVITALAAACAPALAADLAKGKQLADTQCAACHGPEGNKPIDPSYPRLAGQYADYLTVALQSYKTKDKQVVGRSNATMVGMAATLSDAEVKQVAAYLSGLSGDLKTVQHTKFR